MVSANWSKNDSKQDSSGRTIFPSEFLNQFSSAYGPGVGINELLAGMPRTSSLFGGQPVGIFPAQQQPMPPASMGGPGQAGFGFGGYPGSPYGGPQQPQQQSQQLMQMLGFNPQQQPGGGQMPMPLGPPPQGMGQQPAPGQPQPYFPVPGGPAGPPQTFGVADVSALMSLWPDATGLGSAFQTALSRMGLNSESRLTLDQIGQLGQQIPGMSSNRKFQQFFDTFLPGNLNALAGLRPDANRFQASGSPVGVDVMGGLQRLGFGQMPQQAQQQAIRDGQTQLYGPQAMAAQSQIAPQGFEQFQSDLFASQFEPVERSLTRQGELADRRLTDELAQRGISASGAGVGQLQTQRREQQQQVQAAATDAANRASTQRFGLQYQQEHDNAAMRQQTALANAGFDLQAQQGSIDNILRGDLARADNYLKTIGLNNEMANQARTQFLNLTGMQQADLARMDAFQQQSLGLILNNWLQEGALATGAGGVQTGTGRGSGKSSGFGILS